MPKPPIIASAEPVVIACSGAVLPLTLRVIGSAGLDTILPMGEYPITRVSVGAHGVLLEIDAARYASEGGIAIKPNA